jgi:hypothetical protein
MNDLSPDPFGGKISDGVKGFFRDSIHSDIFLLNALPEPISGMSVECAFIRTPTQDLTGLNLKSERFGSIVALI